MFWDLKVNKMIKCAMLLSLCCMCLFGLGQVIAAPVAKDHKTLILMGGSAFALRSSAKQDAEIAFNAVLDETIVNPDMKLHVSVYETTEEIYAAFDKGEIDGIFGSPLEFLGRMDQLGEESMALFYRGRGVKQSFVLVARSGNTQIQINDLKGKRLTLAKFQDMEALYLNTLLLRNQLPEIPEFFSERQDSKNSNLAIMDVFFNKSDATVVRESEYLTAIELNPQIGKKLVVIDKSVPYLPAIGGIRKIFDKEKVKRLMEDIERVSDTTQGSRVLTLTQATSIVKIKRDQMSSTIDLMSEYETLRKANLQKKVSTPIPRLKTREKRHAH